MDSQSLDRVTDILNTLTTDNTIRPEDAETRIIEILTTVLEHKGYEIRSQEYSDDLGIDLVAVNDDIDSIGVEIKFSPQRRPFNAESLHRLIGKATQGGLRQYLFLTNSGLTSNALKLAREVASRNINVADLETIRAWIEGIRRQIERPSSAVRELVLHLSRDLIRLIAAKPQYLWEIEWRDLERVLAEAFEGLGFGVELTPPAKDGGKDLILTCSEHNTKKSYIVEIKHWVSGQGVQGQHLKKFVSVVINQRHDSGLFLSTSGYAGNAFEALGQVEYKKIHVGNKEKVLTICETYVKAESGLWAPNMTLTELLFDGTKEL